MKNINNIIIKAAAVIVAAFALSSCLEKYPKDSILDTEAMTSLNGAEQIVTGIYTAYMSSGLYSGNLTLLPDIQSDLVMAVEGNSNTHGEISYANTLNRLRLGGLLVWLIKPFEKILRKNLLSAHPSMFLFQLYKLYFYLKRVIQKE